MRQYSVCQHRIPAINSFHDVCACVCVCVCVCERERERETDRQTDSTVFASTEYQQ